MASSRISLNSVISDSQQNLNSTEGAVVDTMTKARSRADQARGQAVQNGERTAALDAERRRKKAQLEGELIQLPDTLVELNSDLSNQIKFDMMRILMPPDESGVK